MAGLTKEQREARELEKEKQMEKKIREKLEKEFAEKLKSNTTEKEKTNINKSVKNKIPLDYEVPVTSNTTGKLIFISKRSNGYSVEWDEYGMTEYIEIGELLSMRNTDRRFFEDNWIIIGNTDDYSASEIYKFLKIDKYYKNVYSPDNIDEFFELSPNEMTKKILTLSKGVQEGIALKAQDLINSGELDSKKKIDALSSALNVEFTMN